MRNLIASSALVVAALLAATPGALAQSGNPPRAKAFCLQNTNGPLNCNYDSMAQCEAAKRGQGQGQSLSCVPSPSESVGSGGGSRTPAPAPR
jgi:hypothetical protein